MAEQLTEKSKRRTLFALALGYFVDQGETQAMSVLFPTLQRLWGLSYTSLGLIGTTRHILQAVTAPIWGYVSDRYSRKMVLVIGTGIWGVWTLACGLTQNFGQLLAIRAISGIGLGCLMPATFSLMADSYSPKERGRALSSLEAIGVTGIIIGTVGLGLLATPDLWRWGFIILGLFSMLSGLVVWWLVDEPIRGASEPELEGKITESHAARYQINFSDIPKILKIPTIWVAIVQGLAGSMPWVILGLYFITWLVNERNLTEETASYAFAAIVVGTVISVIAGGQLGDWADRVNPKYGRTIIGQSSVIFAVPLSYFLITGTKEWGLIPFLMWCFFTALFISWSGKGSKEPMMQCVTPPELRSLVFSFVTFVESGFAALVAYVAGVLADKIDLTTALIWTVPVPWIICAIFYSGFYFTYPKDTEKLRALMAKRAKEISN